MRYQRSAAMGWVGAGCYAEIEHDAGDAGRVAVVVGGVGFGAGGGDLFAAGGLGVLPCGDIRGTAGGEWRRLEGAAIGRGAGVLVDPEGDVVEMSSGDEFADVLDCGNGLAWGVVDGLATGVDAREVAGAGYGFGPGEEVGGLVGSEAATFLLVQKENGVSGEVFSRGGGDGCGGVFGAKCGWRGAVAFGSSDLRVGFAVGEDKEAESVSEEGFALAGPGVVVCAGGIGEPVSGEGEVAAEGGKGVVAWIFVAVKADRALRRGGWRDRRALRAGGCD